jgi:hypothetical protein
MSRNVMRRLHIRTQTVARVETLAIGSRQFAFCGVFAPPHFIGSIG